MVSWLASFQVKVQPIWAQSNLLAGSHVIGSTAGDAHVQSLARCSTCVMTIDCGCWQVEGLEEVERAFVHVDYALRAEPEHKVSRLAAVVTSPLRTFIISLRAADSLFCKFCVMLAVADLHGRRLSGAVLHCRWSETWHLGRRTCSCLTS